MQASTIDVNSPKKMSLQASCKSKFPAIHEQYSLYSQVRRKQKRGKRTSGGANVVE